jgi:hypothetical protein
LTATTSADIETVTAPPDRTIVALAVAASNEHPEAAGVTVKLVPDVAVPSAFVTAMGPLVAAAGTVAVISVSEPMTKTAVMPLNVTPVVPVKPVPVMTTLVPTGPLVGANEEIVGTAAEAGNIVIAVHRTTDDDKPRMRRRPRLKSVLPPPPGCLTATVNPPDNNVKSVWNAEASRTKHPTRR